MAPPRERDAAMTAAKSTPTTTAPNAGRSAVRAAVIVVAATALLTTAILGPRALAILLLDGMPVLALLAAAAGWGAWPVRWLGFGRRTIAQQTLLAIGMGLGVLSTLTLGLGCAGLLSRNVALGLLIVGMLAGVLRTRVKTVAAPAPQTQAPDRRWLVAALVLVPVGVMLGIMLFGATLPPGVLWTAEARAYDVLEYHLEVPREYYDAGRIMFLPHNVYASFPQQMEALYLLLMYLTGGPLAGAIPAQLLHAACGVLAVLVVAAWAPAGWGRLIGVLSLGAVPWLALLGCLAYVELGLVFFAALSAAIVWDAVRAESDAGWRTVLAAGLLAGLAGGCKYTALVLVDAALPAAWLVAMRGGLRARAVRVAVFGVGAAVAFAPWLVRNAAFTGNPVYPFAYHWFGGAAWSDAQAAQWDHGHHVDVSIGARFALVGQELFASTLFGPAIFVAGVAGLVLARGRVRLLGGVWLLLLIVIWATTTHMPGRFLVVAAVPLAWLAAAGVAGRPRWVGGVLTAVMLVGSAWNAGVLVSHLRAEQDWWGRLGVPLRMLPGATEAFAAQASLVNVLVPDGVGVRLVGEARAFYVRSPVRYAVVFSEDPWLVFAADATPAAAVDWLRREKTGYVVFSWAEIGRLRNTYGFPAWVTPAWVAGLEAGGLRPVPLPAEWSSAEVGVYEVGPRTAAADVDLGRE